MSMPVVVAPTFVEVALTFVLFCWMILICIRAVRSGSIQLGQASHPEYWPVQATQVAKTLSDQLKFPVLFYVLTVLCWVSHDADLAFVVMAWIFVISQIGRACGFHVTGMAAIGDACFLVGALTLMAMWGIFAFRILTGMG